MSRNNLIKDVLLKLAEDKKIHSLVTEDRVDTWKITGRTGELKIEWRALYATKFSAPAGEVLKRITTALKARPHIKK
ncbi:MAG: hypothetical protein H7249_05445 [Chitinophagaceae bacterium]|nr:hypothetical protein [Oligoflexus sp.]